MSKFLEAHALLHCSRCPMVHHAQTAPSIQWLLCDYDTDLVLVPSGCTSLVQPIDVVFNKPFKNVVEKCVTAHMSNNLEQYASECGTKKGAL